MGVPVSEFTPGKGQDKIARVNAVSDLFSSGIVWAPDRRWAKDVIEECNDFPSGANDDLVDSTTQALLRFRNGGEVNNVIFEGFSNKSHDGFLGNGYIGSWCNIGADTNASNLMNNYGIVDVYDYSSQKIMLSGEQFVGLHMGDHSKCGINTMFNTGTAIGVACNLFGPGFFKKHVPSFSFGEPSRLFPYRLEKAIEGIESMMARRGKTLSEGEIEILKFLCEQRELF